MTDISLGQIPAGTIFKGMGFTDRPHCPPAPFIEFQTPDGAVTRRVLIADYTQPTGWRIEDMVSTVSSDFTVSIGTLDERSEQKQP